MRLERDEGLSLYDPFLQIVPPITARLKSVTIRGTPENLREITAQLSHPTPLLESLAIEAKCECSPQCLGHAITTGLFGGDLSSLRKLHLRCIRTELPWRNMINLMSFTLGYTAPGESPVGCLLDFFESAPCLCKIWLHFAAPTFGTQRGRLVSLECLKRMKIVGGSPSLLLDHLLIPAGAKLYGSFHLPKSLDFPSIFFRFRIHLYVRGFYPSIRGWKISILPATPPPTTTCRVLEALAQVDPSNIERLRLEGADLMGYSGCDHHPALERMTDLRSITISRCNDVSGFMNDLSWSDHLCQNLEELILDPRVDGGKFDIQTVINLAARRASWDWAKLKSVRIVSWDKSVQANALKLKEHVPHVECSPRVALVTDDVDSSDDED